MPAYPKCPHCQSMYFDLSENTPTGANYKIFIINCTSCGAPFGAMEYYDFGSLLKKQEALLARIEHAIETLEQRLRRVEQAVTH